MRCFQWQVQGTFCTCESRAVGDGGEMASGRGLGEASFSPGQTGNVPQGERSLPKGGCVGKVLLSSSSSFSDTTAGQDIMRGRRAALVGRMAASF